MISLLNSFITIVREKRHSISLIPDLPHGVIVKAPKYVSDEIINSYLRTKAPWFLHLQSIVKTHSFYLHFISIKSGDRIAYLGKEYIVKCYHSNNKNIYFDDQYLIIASPQYFSSSQKTKQLIHWYKTLAYDLFLDRIYFYCLKLSVPIPSLRIKKLKSRWGSCSSKQNINLNWVLIKAPFDVIDYVVLHECCHLIHMNHSKNFWDLVRYYMPDYKTHEKWLKDFGPLLLT